MNFWEFAVQTADVWGTVLTVLAGGAVGVVATQFSERSKRKADAEDRNKDLAQQAAVQFLAAATDSYNQSKLAASVVDDKKSSMAQIAQSTAVLTELVRTTPVQLQQHLLTLRILGYSDVARSAAKIGPILANVVERKMDTDQWLEASKDFADLCVATFGETKVEKKR